MKLFWHQNKILVLFFVFLTAITVASFFETAREEKPRALIEIISEPSSRIVSEKDSSDRSPASVGDKSAKQQQASQKIIINSQQKIALVIFCDAKSLRINSSSHLLMLELTSCPNLKEKNQLWIKNETNGFKAQIFKINANKFKTDFIQLNHGVNKLSLQGVLKDGQKVEQTLEILSGS